MIVVGLDPGVTTGYARWDCEAMRMLEVTRYKIHQAMDAIRAERPALVLFEDARLRKAFWKADAEAMHAPGRREGAGAAKRDAKIWEDFLLDIGVPFLPRAPNKTKVGEQYFKTVSGYQERTNEHGRDAGMIVAGINSAMATGLIRHHHDNLKRAADEHQRKLHRNRIKAALKRPEPAPSVL